MNRPILIADTMVISEMHKGAWDYTERLAPYDVRISPVTEAELQCWAERNRWGARRRFELQQTIARYPIIGYSKGMAEVFARITVETERAGLCVGWADRWIATTAIWHGVELATNDSDFQNISDLRVMKIGSAQPRNTPRWPRRMPTPSSMRLAMRSECSYR